MAALLRGRQLAAVAAFTTAWAVGHWRTERLARHGIQRSSMAAAVVELARQKLGQPAMGMARR
eukprot:8967093-Lingulodinium_polyedra.AAC.2